MCDPWSFDDDPYWPGDSGEIWTPIDKNDSGLIMVSQLLKEIEDDKNK